MKVNVYSVGGKAKTEVELPEAFQAPIRQDLIRRAVNTAQANRRQAYGPNARAGMRHAASTWGKGRGVARVQRMKQGSTAVESPNNVGGRRAHPPRPERDWSEKMNRKERQAAFKSALAATAQASMVSQRGHRFSEAITLPLILDKEFEQEWLTKSLDDEMPLTRRGLRLLEGLGLDKDLTRARNGRHIRAGRGKLRGRKYRTPRSVLLVFDGLNGTELAFTNLPGVDVTTAANLNTEDLAPGGDAGRLTLFSQQALASLTIRLSGGEPA